VLRGCRPWLEQVGCRAEWLQSHGRSWWWALGPLGVCAGGADLGGGASVWRVFGWGLVVGVAG
jgi:hypothetical protein